ncbi:uncharacterized protein LOC125495573 [Beta vulgaris subsp. vulgaris]|uniref:uncharacterized protein LOC125495573 n=1 Tax=Beta vulgaris subsp. vulgaris TaxID=3555 RepID=UPI002036C140|nr:uncharacterized protein LOC125495573 [Beta vulgaris subsp. vulgaris]
MTMEMTRNLDMGGKNNNGGNNHANGDGNYQGNRSNYQEKGHKANQCPKRQNNGQIKMGTMGEIGMVIGLIRTRTTTTASIYNNNNSEGQASNAQGGNNTQHNGQNNNRANGGNNNQNDNENGARGNNGRIYVMNQNEADTNANVVTGLVNCNPAYLLFDYGASHSFIASSFVERLGLEPSILCQTFITIPSGEVVSCSSLYQDILFTILGSDLPADLIQFDLPDFSVILGMD